MAQPGDGLTEEERGHKIVIDGIKAIYRYVPMDRTKEGKIK